MSDILKHLLTLNAPPHPLYPNNPLVRLSTEPPNNYPFVPMPPIKRSPEQMAWLKAEQLRHAHMTADAMLDVILQCILRPTDELSAKRVIEMTASAYEKDEQAFKGAFVNGAPELIAKVEQSIAEAWPEVRDVIAGIRQYHADARKPFDSYSDNVVYDSLPTTGKTATKVGVRADCVDDRQPIKLQPSVLKAGQQYDKAVSANPRLAGDKAAAHKWLVENLGRVEVAKFATFKRYLTTYEAARKI